MKNFRPFRRLQSNIARYKEMDALDKKRYRHELLIANSLYIFIFFAVIYIQTQNPNFLKLSSLINIFSLTAASLPVALGIAGTIVLTGTDLSAGRVVGITACIAASLLQPLDYASKMFPGMGPWPIIVVLALVMLVGALVGLVNGFFVARYSLHPFIVTLATQLIVYGALLMYLQIGNNRGSAVANLDEGFKNFIKGSFISIKGTPIPNYVWYSVILTIIMWFIWNKTIFGKNMFAVGSNPQAAEVSGVNVQKTMIIVFVLAGIYYSLSGMIEAARVGSNSSTTGLNAESDAIAACVIGGVSFVGGIGKISGIVIGVVLLRLIFIGLNMLSINQNLQYIIKGMIILVACAVDMRKYLVRK